MKIGDFDNFLKDFIDFKKYTHDNFTKINAALEEKSTSGTGRTTNALEDDNAFLKQEIKNKQLIIDILLEDIKSMKDENIQHEQKISWHSNEEKNKSLEKIIREKDEDLDDPVYKKSNADENCNWENVLPRKNKDTLRDNKQRCRNDKNNNIQLHNRFDGFCIDDNVIEINDIGMDGFLMDHNINEDTGIFQNNKTITNQYSSDNDHTNSRRPNIVINENPESDIREYGTKIVPGNGSYSRITSEGKRIHIYGASLIKRLKGKEMATFIKLKNKTFIRSFPGSTASYLNEYVKPTLREEKPDIVVINAGSNDVARDEKSAKEIAENVIGIGHTCRQEGVNEIFISSLIIQSKFKSAKLIGEINILLKQLCEENHFKYVDNSNILKGDLWKDGLHLLDGGLTKLGNNFINAINYNLY